MAGRPVLDDFGGGEGVAAAAGLRGSGGERAGRGRTGEGYEGEGESERERAHPRSIARIVKISLPAAKWESGFGLRRRRPCEEVVKQSSSAALGPIAPAWVTSLRS
ncbi:hypothetical protein [Methylobacterium sp. J-070]|uniref:hypothetical protein n=1 Tax=Methylobacterium sp. J-070 TaxID=2836650 RepID=UPI001FBB9A9E|nr:hypothetical protein [Methylobacterium sp. J-070]MCJ2049938.1 hypothetical protein [Methylobacterium sp. J-070]